MQAKCLSYKSADSNMKWILLVFVNLLQNISCDYSNIGKDVRNVLYPTKMVRGARTLSFDSKEDESGIHLHIWNDLNNRDNFYPHLMKQIAETGLQSEPPSPPPSNLPQSDDSNSNSNHIHINMNEPLPQPQSQISPENFLKNTLLQTLGLDEYRKSDQNLYESFYKLNAERIKQNPSSWSYHPSAINYIPKAYNTNLNNAIPGYLIKTVSSFGPKVRPTLHDQMDTDKSTVQDYYTNLHKKKPKSVIDAVGYEIGGLPKYSGRLLANEPMPQQYRTFQMFEPVPRQIMLPPPTTRIPEFKPVPPKLKIIPVIEDFFENRPSPVHPQMLPWTVIKPGEQMKSNFIQAIPVKQVQIIPFRASEAITKAPIRKYIPKTEYNYIEPTTESYYQSQPLSDSESFESRKTFLSKLKPLKIPTQAPTLIDYLDNQENQLNNHQDIYNQSNVADSQYAQSQYSYEPMNGQFMNKQQNQTDLNFHDPYVYEYITKIKNTANVGVNSMKLVPNEDSRSTLNNDIIINPTKKSVNKKAKTARKPHRTHDNTMNDVVKLNVTGFHNISEYEEKRIKNHRSSDSNKKESHTKDGDQFYGQTQSYNDYPIDSVSADSVQLSQTYSKQTTNVPHSKPTASIRHQDTLLMELANDVKKALLTSMGNESKSIDYQTDEFEEDAQKDPFLIAVFDEKDNPKHEPENHLDDVTIEDIKRKDSFSRGTMKQGHIQRINKDWASNRKDIVKINVNKRADDNRRRNESKDEIYASNHRNDSEISAMPNETQSNGTIDTPYDLNVANSTTFDDKYYKWFSKYAEENKKNGRTVISEHFKKVEIEPNISWVILPR